MALKQIGLVIGKHPREDEVEKNHPNKLDLLPPCPGLITDLPSSLAPSQTLRCLLVPTLYFLWHNLAFVYDLGPDRYGCSKMKNYN